MPSHPRHCSCPRCRSKLDDSELERIKVGRCWYEATKATKHPNARLVKAGEPKE